MEAVELDNRSTVMAAMQLDKLWKPGSKSFVTLTCEHFYMGLPEGMSALCKAVIEACAVAVENGGGEREIIAAAATKAEKLDAQGKEFMAAFTRGCVELYKRFASASPAQAAAELRSCAEFVPPDHEVHEEHLQLCRYRLENPVAYSVRVEGDMLTDEQYKAATTRAYDALMARFGSNNKVVDAMPDELEPDPVKEAAWDEAQKAAVAEGMAVLPPDSKAKISVFTYYT